MKAFIKAAFYLWHPIWIPFASIFFYFWLSPRFVAPNHIKAKLLATAILTIAIPVIFMTMLINTKLATSLQLHERRAKGLFLFCFSALILSLNQFVIGKEILEIYYFLTALSISLILLLLCNRIKVNGSMHLLGLSASLGFAIGLSLLYHYNLLYLIAGLIFVMGWTASNRLSEGKHSLSEIFLGALLGILPQCYFISIALMHYRM